MSADGWEDLKEEIRTQLLIGKENGETELKTMARIVWLERQRHLTSEQLCQAAVAALEAVEKAATFLYKSGTRSRFSKRQDS
jgi:hypothetical protein